MFILLCCICAICGGISIISYAIGKYLDKDVSKRKLKNKGMKKDELERVILCDLQNDIYPDLERIFLKSIKDAGFPDMKLDKKIDFEKLYQQKLN